MLDREIVPRFGRDLVTAITRHDLPRLSAEITDAGHPTNANRAVAYCSAMLTFAMRRGDVTSNPAAAVKRTPELGRDVEPLTDQQEAALGKALDDAEAAGEAWQAIELVRFLFLNGCRRSEGEHLQWTEVDDERRQLVFLDPGARRRASAAPIAATGVSICSRSSNACVLARRAPALSVPMCSPAMTIRACPAAISTAPGIDSAMPPDSRPGTCEALRGHCRVAVPGVSRAQPVRLEEICRLRTLHICRSSR